MVNYDIIPGQVYVKGFIRNYGNYLDLDGDRFVKSLPKSGEVI